MNTKDILERALRNQHFRRALMQGSFNREHYAKQRLDEFCRMLANTAKIEKVRSFFSAPNLGAVGYPSGGGFQNFGTVIQLASLTSLVSSIAGLVALEKSVDMPNLTIYLPDLVSVTGAPPVYPVAGAYQYSDTGISQQVLQFDATPSPAASSVTAAPFSTVGIPGLSRSYKLTITAIDSNGNKATYTILDSGDGQFLIPAPSVTVNGITITFPSQITIGYGSSNLVYGGAISTFTVSSSSNLTSVVFTLTFDADFPGQNAYPVNPNDTRLRLSMREFTVNTKQNKIEAEIDLFLVHGLQKSMNTDIVSLLTERLSNTLTDLINRYIAQVYVRQILPQAGIIEIDASTPIGTGGPAASSYNQYNPIVDKIMGELEGVNYVLAKRSFIGLTANAYLVSPRMAYWLARTGLIDPSNFVREDSRFINGLVGYYRGVPVIVNMALESVFDGVDTATAGSNMHTAGGFAIHNLVENNLSPALYATFLPITAGPTVGNFNNTVQQAFALFHQSDAIPFVKELVVPFRFRGLPVLQGL
jgi:hypothetical protein